MEVASNHLLHIGHNSVSMAEIYIDELVLDYLYKTDEKRTLAIKS